MVAGGESRKKNLLEGSWEHSRLRAWNYCGNALMDGDSLALIVLADLVGRRKKEYSAWRKGVQPAGTARPE
jgi:hypothetical protein